MINRFYILALILLGAVLWSGCDREGFITEPEIEENDPDPQEVDDTKLTGNVFDLNNNGLEGAQVDIFLDGEHEYSTWTDPNGNFAFDDLALISGTYRMLVTKEGYISRTELVHTDALELESIELHLLESDHNQDDASTINENTTNIIEYTGRILSDGVVQEGISVLAFGLGIDPYMDYDFTDENGYYHLLLKTDVQYIFVIENSCLTQTTDFEFIGPFTQNIEAQDRNIQLTEVNTISVEGVITTCGTLQDIEVIIADNPFNPSFEVYTVAQEGILSYSFETCDEVPENLIITPAGFSQPWNFQQYSFGINELIEIDQCDSTLNSTNELNFWYGGKVYDLSANVTSQQLGDENLVIVSEEDGHIIELVYQELSEDIYIAEALHLLLSTGEALELSGNDIEGEAYMLPSEITGYFNSTALDSTTGCPLILGGFTIVQ